MSIPPVQTSTFGPDARLKPEVRRNRVAERLVLTVAAVLGVLTLALWQVPPMLDWSRYKGAVAAYAGARLGRRVTIDGRVGLSLLPRAMLTAEGVTLADRGDGISAKLGTMRLEVSLRGLLAGHVVPRTLTLDDPVAVLPWPIPRGAAPRVRPAMAAEFSATLMGGTLHLGGITFRQIAASLHTDPDSGAFGARGSVMAAGLPWRFTAFVGAPGADGASPLTLTLDGQAPYGNAPAIRGLLGTGGAFHGRILADGTVAGDVMLRGPSLSVLGAAPALPWQVQGAVRGDGITLRAPALQVALGQATGTADASLSLGARLALRLRLALGQVALGDWAWRLLSEAPAMADLLPADLDITAGTASLRGGTITAPHLALALGSDGAAIRTATAILPGGARLDFSGAIHPGAGLAGTLHVAAQEARQSLHWLTEGGSDALPPGVLRQADLSGTMGVAGAQVAWTGLSGRIDDAAISGGMVFGLGPRPSIGLDLDSDRLDLSAWLPSLCRAGPGRPAVLALDALAAPFMHADARLQLRIGRLLVPGLVLDHAVLDAEGNQGGLTVHPSSARVAGGRLTLSGSVGPDGTLAAARAEFATEEAALLPVSWRKPATLWHGPLHVLLSAAGPAADTAAQLRADLGDLRAEAEAHIDQTTPSATATVTVRHPGAPRLLADLGLAGADAWLEHGSLAVLTHVTATQGHVQIKDFSIAAAALHAGGALDADFSQAVPFVTGDIDAGVLALPAVSLRSSAAMDWDLLRRVQADVHIRSANVLAALRPVASAITAHLLVSGGVAALEDVGGTAFGGSFTARLAADATQTPPMLSALMRIGQLQFPPADDGAPPTSYTLYGGSMEAEASFTAQGIDAQALLASSSGTVAGALSNVTLTGIDLPAVTASLGTRRPGLKSSLTTALRRGASGALSGDFAGVLDHGALGVSHLSLAGAAGSISASGVVELPGGRTDLHAAIVPAVPEKPRLGLAAAGIWGDLVPVADLSAALPAQKHRARRR